MHVGKDPALGNSHYAHTASVGRLMDGPSPGVL